MEETYAILGATGQIGSHILQLLLRDHPTAHINLLIRSRAKLDALFRNTTTLDNDNNNNNNENNTTLLDTHAHRLHIYEGTITDTAILAKCLYGVKTAFLTVATMYNTPHCRIAQDQAEAVVKALQDLAANANHNHNDNRDRRPLLVMISSAETEPNPFCLDLPQPFRSLLFYCNYWIYTDLIAAERYLRQQKDWVDTVYFKPGGIAHDIQRGHILSTEKSMTFISFWDVAAGMIACGQETHREDLAGKSVSVLANGHAKFPWTVPFVLLQNLTGYLFPRLYQWVF